MSEQQELLKKLYVRVCRDSRFQLEATRAAALAASIAKAHPLQVWLTLGWDNMQRIAEGNHPALSNPKYIGAAP